MPLSTRTSSNWQEDLDAARTGAQPPTPKRTQGGCLAIFIGLVLLLATAFGGYFFVLPRLRPNVVRGKFLALIPVTAAAGKTKLWVYTDHSLNFSYKTTGGGSTKSGVSCIFCKTITYIYDPVRQTVDQQWTTEVGGRVATPAMYLKGGKVWIVSGKLTADAPYLEVRDAATGALTMDLAAFAKSLPQLQSGIADLRAAANPDRLEITTKDGQALSYQLDDGTIGANDMRKPAGSEMVSLFALAGKSGEKRKALFLLTGPRNKLGDADHAGSFAADPEQAHFFLDATSEPIAVGHFFIEPLLVYQDAELAVVLHQSEVGGDADRMLTCVEASGRVRWTAPQSALFSEARVGGNKSFSSMFFMKDKFSGQRAGDVFIFGLKEVGAIGFDLQSGRQRWRIAP